MAWATSFRTCILVRTCSQAIDSPTHSPKHYALRTTPPAHHHISPGYDVIAISDLSAEFAKSCGACYEVRCREEAYTDGKGNSYDGQVCHNTTESLVVRVVDACPCNYPNNAYSNQRWCCQDQGAGDMHVDMSIWAFEKLASKNKGSMALSFRQVPCNYMPPFPAYAREAETPKDQPPSSARKPHESIFIKREDDKGVLQGAVNRVDQDENTWGEIIPVGIDLDRRALAHRAPRLDPHSLSHSRCALRSFDRATKSTATERLKGPGGGRTGSISSMAPCRRR